MVLQAKAFLVQFVRSKLLLPKLLVSFGYRNLKGHLIFDAQLPPTPLPPKVDNKASFINGWL